MVNYVLMQKSSLFALQCVHREVKYSLKQITQLMPINIQTGAAVVKDSYSANSDKHCRTNFF